MEKDASPDLDTILSCHGNSQITLTGVKNDKVKSPMNQQKHSSIIEHLNVAMAKASQDMIVEVESKTPVHYAKPMIKFA